MQKGFTLIELIVSIAVIGALVWGAIAIFSCEEPEKIQTQKASGI